MSARELAELLVIDFDTALLLMNECRGDTSAAILRYFATPRPVDELSRLTGMSPAAVTVLLHEAGNDSLVVKYRLLGLSAPPALSSGARVVPDRPTGGAPAGVGRGGRSGATGTTTGGPSPKPVPRPRLQQPSSPITMAAPAASVPDFAGKEEAGDCPICMTPLGPNVVAFSTCSHPLCRECFDTYSQSLIFEQGKFIMTCPVPSCKRPYAPLELRHHMSALGLTALETRSLDHAVAADPSMRTCRLFSHRTTPDCTYVVAWTPGDADPSFVCPACEESSCLACRARPAHPGLSCDEARAAAAALVTAAPSESTLKARAAEEEATRQYMASSGVRLCPQCGVGVQKEFGCSKMMFGVVLFIAFFILAHCTHRCRCGYKFCYDCMAPNAICAHTPRAHGFWDNTEQEAVFVKS